MNKTDHQNYPPIVEMKNATVRRNGKHILDQLSLKIHLDEHTAIIGPNGSGKSTFIKLITQSVYPLANKEGTPPVRMYGRDQWKLDWLNSKISIVSADLQNSFLHNTKEGHITGRETVLSGFFSSMRLFPHQTITHKMITRADDALDLMDATHLADKMLNVMSTGEIRRVLIARALVNTPEVLVLDEPTTSLDFVARHNFMNQIRNVVHSGTTLILVTHHIEEIIPEIERVILLKEGRTAYDGLKEDILTSKNLSDIFGHPVRLSRKNGLYRVGVD